MISSFKHNKAQYQWHNLLTYAGDFNNIYKGVINKNILILPSNFIKIEFNKRIV